MFSGYSGSPPEKRYSFITLCIAFSSPFIIYNYTQNIPLQNIHTRTHTSNAPTISSINEHQRWLIHLRLL